MSLSLRKPARPAKTVRAKTNPQVTSIEEHKNIRGAPKNLYSSRNYSSQKDSSLDPELEEEEASGEDSLMALKSKTEPLSLGNLEIEETSGPSPKSKRNLETSSTELGVPFEEFSAPEDTLDVESATSTPKDVMPVAESISVRPPLREHSPKKLVLGVNDPQDSRSADEYLSSLGLKVEYTVEGKKGNYVLVQTPENQHVYVRVPKTRRIYNSLRSTSPRRRPINNQTCLNCESTLHTPYSALVRNATVKACRPECVGAVFSSPHTGITTFADETGFESYIVKDGHMSNFPLPVLDFEDVQAHPKDSLQAVEKVHLRLERHLLAECDDHIESLVELYNDFQNTFTSFIQLSDDAFQACNNSPNRNACERLLTACVNLPEVLDRLQSAHEILQTNANSFK